MWWILQLIGIVGVVCIHTFNRWAGLHTINLMIKWGVNAGAQICIAPFFILSYQLAPSFFQPWFLGTVLIFFLGFLVSLFFFGEVLTITKIAGAAFAIISAVLLII